jgi:hypothetical protein
LPFFGTDACPQFCGSILAISGESIANNSKLKRDYSEIRSQCFLFHSQHCGHAPYIKGFARQSIQSCAAEGSSANAPNRCLTDAEESFNLINAQARPTTTIGAVSSEHYENLSHD